MKTIPLLCSLCLCLQLSAALPEGAPPSFEWQGKTVVPVDFHDVDLSLRFDVTGQSGTGLAVIRFQAPEAGLPLMDMVPQATALRLNGARLDPSELREIASPDNRTKLRVLNQPVFAFSLNTLEIEYRFPATQVTFSNGGVRLGFFMGDVGSADQRGFLEKFAPSNLEFDAFSLRLTVELEGAAATHQLFTNGEILAERPDYYEVQFPPYFTPSSIYFHLSNQNFETRKETYAGVGKTFPITVYAATSDLASRGMSGAKNVLRELEAAYGAFAHDRVVAYITSGGGGMEYCGATITSLSALEHEFTHFWFARGVMPRNGNAGWIDEAVASWRDNGYPTHSSLSGSGSLLAGFPAFQRMTPMAAYSSGARVMGHLDYLFRGTGGLKPVLKALFNSHQRQSITTPYFQEFVERESGESLSTLFAKHVYGTEREAGAKPEIHALTNHPRPFTEQEYRALR